MVKVLERIAATLNTLRSGGITEVIKLTGAQVGVDGAAYSANDVLGDKAPISIEAVRSFSGTGIIHSVTLQDLSKQDAETDIIFFDALPTGTTFTDNAAIDVADEDLPKVIGTVNIAASDYCDFADSSVATVKGINLPIKSSDNSKIYVCLVTRGTPTYVADELSITIGILQD